MKTLQAKGGARLSSAVLAKHPSESGRRAHLLAVSLAGCLLVGLTASSSADEKIGGVEIVINIVQGDLPSGGTVPVNLGDGVYRDEGVRTRVDSKTKLLMEDKTNVTIGPSSVVKLDRFVYAGPKKPGTVVLNLAKGTCRLIIGDANKHAYTSVTPTAAIGVRE
jgi:hypothetical protein